VAGDLFEHAAAAVLAASAPLAARVRPRSLDEVVGQDRVLGPGSPLRRLVEGAGRTSVLLWGPPGSGKTTLARLIAADRRFVELSAVSAGVKDVRAVLDEARERLGRYDERTALFVDEMHRFSKTQQDALLPGVEAGLVTFVGATTENPAFSVVSPLLSRSLVVRLEPLDADAIRLLVRRALADPRGLAGRFAVDDDALEHLVRVSGGDARRALTVLEAGAGVADDLKRDVIDVAAVERAVDRAAVRYDRAGDEHYDIASALIKSIRGGDVDAGLHYLARMIEAGEDPRFVARRLVILASEDIGLADPQALGVAVAAAQAVQLVGLPEGRLNLAEAVIYLALAPKSNAVIRALDDATADIRDGMTGPAPAYLRDPRRYRYPQDFPDGVVAQQYAPDAVTGRDYYRPSGRGAERAAAERLARLRGVLRGVQHGDDEEKTR
jgi:putative ATPase